MRGHGQHSTLTVTLSSRLSTSPLSTEMPLTTLRLTARLGKLACSSIRQACNRCFCYLTANPLATGSFHLLQNLAKLAGK